MSEQSRSQDQFTTHFGVLCLGQLRVRPAEGARPGARSRRAPGSPAAARGARVGMSAHAGPCPVSPSRSPPSSNLRSSRSSSVQSVRASCSVSPSRPSPAMSPRRSPGAPLSPASPARRRGKRPVGVRARAAFCVCEGAGGASCSQLRMGPGSRASSCRAGQRGSTRVHDAAPCVCVCARARARSAR